MDYDEMIEELDRILTDTSDDELLEAVNQFVTQRIDEARNAGHIEGEKCALEASIKRWGLSDTPTVKVSQLPRAVQSDVAEFTVDNESHSPPRSPREYLQCYLTWNGIIGFTDDLILAFHGIEKAAL